MLGLSLYNALEIQPARFVLTYERRENQRPTPKQFHHAWHGWADFLSL
jgi:hypothetical protein